MGRTFYFDAELTRLRRLWVSAVQRRGNDRVRDTSAAYFDRAAELAEAEWGPARRRGMTKGADRRPARG